MNPIYGMSEEIVDMLEKVRNQEHTAVEARHDANLALAKAAVASRDARMLAAEAQHIIRAMMSRAGR